MAACRHFSVPNVADESFAYRYRESATFVALSLTPNRRGKASSADFTSQKLTNLFFIAVNAVCLSIREIPPAGSGCGQ